MLCVHHDSVTVLRCGTMAFKTWEPRQYLGWRQPISTPRIVQLVESIAQICQAVLPCTASDYGTLGLPEVRLAPSYANHITTMM